MTLSNCIKIEEMLSNIVGIDSTDTTQNSIFSLLKRWGFFEPGVVETTEATCPFNTFLVNYVAIFFVIVDYFVYCLGPFTNGGYFDG